MRNNRLIGAARGGMSEVENALVDELLAGRLDRRSFLMHGSRLGLGLPLLGAMAAMAGCSPETSPAPAAGASGGTLTIGIAMPHGEINPLTATDGATYQLYWQTAEFLCVINPDLTLKPVLAESWSPNQDGTVWTFKLRQGVKFHNGQEMKADDVVATFDALSDPAKGSTALSVFKGVLSKGGTRKVDDYTVAFHLDAANGNFPYAVSVDNYNAVILPAGYAGNYEADFMGTGPFRRESYTPRVGATFVRNPDYWGEKAKLDRLSFKFFAEPQPRILALQAGELDMLDAVPIVLASTLQQNPDISILRVAAANHRQVHMKVDRTPFADKRVRRALALTLDRKKLVDGLCNGMAAIGNDSPFGPFYPSTDKTVPQRDIDIAQAKQLMEAAGVGGGFDVQMNAMQYSDIAQYAQLMQDAAKAINIRMNLTVESQAQYYGKSVRGQSHWLDSTMGITDYAHRSTPDVALGEPYLSKGAWNASNFANAEYDRLVGAFTRALDVEAQRGVAGQIQTLLLDETPVIISYFPNLLVPVRKGVTGVPEIAAGLLLGGAAKA
jgi:peptide/nickel transport system substrate-binding protein